ncbi:MAG: amidohydrolase family protein, partial [Bauldia sp.]|nr:amidohydrolase family protein [Bauldia sp.]
DEEALDMLEAVKDRHFVAPGIAWLINTARHAEPWGIKPGSRLTIEYERELEMCVETMKKMHRRGIRICIGGDYGFAWTPQGTNAKDIQTFVEMLGFSPMEAILAATKYGGEIMGMGDELGQIREGYLADLLLVDGDPVANVRVLQEKDRLLAIMKDGKFHKKPQMQEARRRLTA